MQIFTETYENIYTNTPYFVPRMKMIFILWLEFCGKVDNVDRGQRANFFRRGVIIWFVCEKCEMNSIVWHYTAVERKRASERANEQQKKKNTIPIDGKNIWLKWSEQFVYTFEWMNGPDRDRVTEEMQQNILCVNNETHTKLVFLLTLKQSSKFKRIFRNCAMCTTKKNIESFAKIVFIFNCNWIHVDGSSPSHCHTADIASAAANLYCSFIEQFILRMFETVSI